ncbi:MAG TPA: ABC-2 transporter permease [Bacillota bacterium]|nr:ABC-2 transporter permease [Bacillota bacterium]
MLAVLQKEFRTYFLTPLGYIFMGFFLLISGFFFALNNLFPASSNLAALLGSLTSMFMFVVPILTMRLLSEETRQKTDQLLLTSPLKVTEIVVGKYLAAVAVFLITILITGIYPAILRIHGFISISEVLGGYIGFFLLGSCFIAVGLFVSALTDNQVSAAVITFSSLLFMWIMDAVQQVLPNDTNSGVIFACLILFALAFLVHHAVKNLYVTALTAFAGSLVIGSIYAINKSLYDGIIIKIFDWFSLLKRYDGFSSGLLNVSSIIYYLSFITAFIFLTVQLIEKRRWN